MTKETIQIFLLTRALILCEGFAMDYLIGDPHSLWHPVQGIGKLIELMERLLRKLFGIEWDENSDHTEKFEKSSNSYRRRNYAAGTVLAITVPVISCAIPVGLLAAAQVIHPALRIVISCIFAWQILAAGSLRRESMKVHGKLLENDLEGARAAVSMIVGRDTQYLVKEGIIRAAVETTAENTSDGVTAPLFYMLLFGVPGGFLYKAVNTMDSMIGYRNEKYKWFGTAAAKMDDILNYLPSRITALYMIAAAWLLRNKCETDAENAVRIWNRDRRKHASPNSAQTESVCAGALHVQLAGDASYGGVFCHKETIGDPDREIRAKDIETACRLMYVTSFLMLADGIFLYLFIAVLVQLSK